MTNVLALGGIEHLTESLPSVRQLLSAGWSPSTAYPGSVDSSRWMPGDPLGQCGVSATWLAEMIFSSYGIEATFCRGVLRFGNRWQHDLTDHCWLELPSTDGHALVLDITCDQAIGFDTPYLLEPKKALAGRSVRFVTRDQMSRANLPANRVWIRYKMLLRNLERLRATPIQEAHETSRWVSDSTCA